MLTCFLIYTFALGPSGMTAYYRFLKAAAINYMCFLYYSHGNPKFSKAYLATVVQDQTSHYLWYCFIFFMFPPVFLAVLPIFLGDLTHLAWYCSCTLQIVSPGFHATCGGVCDKVVPSLIGHTNWNGCTVSQKWSAVNAALPSICADIEVGLGLLLVVQMLTPFRNFILLFVFWQFLRIRYIISPPIKDAFHALDEKMGAFLNHKYAPPFFSSGYSKFKGFLSSQTALPKPGESAMPKMPKCTIM